MYADKVAIITGSSSGIGEATAKLFLKNGYQVVITGSNCDKLVQVAKGCIGLSQKGFEPLVVVADLSQPENVDLILEKTIERFGRLDVLVNNAACFNCVDTKEATSSYDAYRDIMSINLDSTVRLSLASISYLKKTRGNIVNVSSVYALKPSDCIYAYCISKAAMCMFAKCLAIDVGKNHIRVNTVLPGPVATPLLAKHGLIEDKYRDMESNCLGGRMGTSDEIAKAIAYLASEDAAFVTGTDLVIDGGFSIKPATSVNSNMQDSN